MAKVMASGGILRTPVVVAVVVVVFFCFVLGIQIYYFDLQLTIRLTCLNLRCQLYIL